MIISLSKRYKQQGAALIMALLLVAIVSAIAMGIFYSQRVAIYRQIMTENSDQVYRDATYAPYWALKVLQTQQQQLTTQQTPPNWPITLPVMSLPNGDTLSASIQPLTGLFNINNLSVIVSPYLNVFINLLMSADNTLTKEQAQQIAQNVQAWVSSATPGQSDSNAYASFSPPYHMAHQLMVDPSELLQVAGVSANLYATIKPALMALPNTNTKIDINSAPKLILEALLDNDEQAADAVIQYRSTNGGFSNVSQFSAIPGVAPHLNNNQLSTIISIDFPTFYQLDATVTRQNQVFHIQIGLQINLSTNSLVVLWQNQG